ncbi:hypothetical protein ACHAXS_000497, partial [Conticribra weissflogii]
MNNANKHPIPDDLDKKPPAKRPRKKAIVQHDVIIPLDALTIVLEFLSPPDLFNAAFLSKTLQGAVTTRMVVKSALLHGGYAKRTMKELRSVTTSNSIHVPSPLRLLRLSCGKRCEVCFSDKVNFVRPGWGLFACWTCVTEGPTKAWSTKWVRYGRNECAYKAVFGNPRVVSSKYGRKYFMLRHPMTDASGEPIGPIVCFDDVDKMVNHVGGFDDYFAKVLHAPEPEAYNEFNNSFEAIEELAREALLERERLKNEKDKKSKKKKQERIEEFLVDLGQMLDEPFRSEAMIRAEDCCGGPFPRMKMFVPFVNEMLQPYIDAPTKMKPPILEEIAQKINEKFRLISEKNFLQLDFLRLDDPFELRLKQAFENHITSLDDFVKFGRYCHPCTRFNRGSSFDDKFISYLEKDELIDALVHYLRDCLHLTLVPVIRDAAGKSPIF